MRPCLAVGRQALGDADARAVELSRGPLVNGPRSARLARIGGDEVSSPPKWQRLILKAAHVLNCILISQPVGTTVSQPDNFSVSHKRLVNLRQCVLHPTVIVMDWED